MYACAKAGSLWLGSDELLQNGSSPTTASAPPFRLAPTKFAWRSASSARSSPGALPNQTPSTPS